MLDRTAKRAIADARKRPVQRARTFSNRGFSMPSKRFARVNSAVCVACGTCETVCPRGAAVVDHGCVAVINTAVCIGCGACATECPTNCIELADRREGA